MARSRKPLGDVKEPSTAATVNGPDSDNGNTSSGINYSTDSLENQAFSIADDAKGRHFGFVVYPSETWIRLHCPECEYDGADGWGTAPDDWQDQLRQTGLAFSVSPLHWYDLVWDAENETWRVKKPHWHIIVSWGNSTTYRSARALCDMLKCPRPIVLRGVTGYYRYFNHRDNPEKAQYAERPSHFNGWERPMEGGEVEEILAELEEAVYLHDCIEYPELLCLTRLMGPEYSSVARKHTFFLTKVCSGYRNNPFRVLTRYLQTLPDGETADAIKARLDKLTGQGKEGK